MITAQIHYADYYQKKGFVSVADGDAFKRIGDIAETFGVPLTGPGGIRRGFNWLGAATCPNQPQIVLWWPTRDHNSGGWINEFKNNDQKILEYNVDHEMSRIHVERRIDENRDRAVFAKEPFGRRDWCYRFIGVFKLNAVESRRTCKADWERIPDVDRFNV